MLKQGKAKIALLVSCSIFISSCDANDIKTAEKLDPIDRAASLTRDDFKSMRDLNSVKKPAEVTANVSNVIEPKIPELAEILAAPPKPKIGESQLVSLSVTDDVSLKDVLIEVARLAKVDIDVDASITGGVSMSAKNRPFNEVIERISDMAGLRYNMRNGVLRIERDTPYIQVYTLDLLNIDRNSQSAISSGGAGGGGGSGGSGSSSSITYKADSDFWAKFEGSISQILSYSPAQRSSASTVMAQPVPASPAPESAIPAVPAAPTPALPTSPAVATPPAASSSTILKPQQAKFSAPAPAAPSAASAPAAAAPLVEGNKVSYILNRQAGTLTVSASQKQHATIKKFIDTISKNAASQVLIEAKIVEVDLNDDYQTGINWNKLGGTSLNFTGGLDTVTAASSLITVPKISLIKNDVLRTGLNLDTAVSLLDTFGTTRGISSPRLHAVNNQQAVLSFAENIIYFDVKLSVTDAVAGTSTTAGTPAKVDVNSTQKSTPVGLILNLQPSIDQGKDEVTLSIRPTITKKTKDINDPGFEISKASAIAALGANTPAGIALTNTHSTIPQIETKELDSIVKIKSGQTLVIGGLLEDKITNTDTGVPYASEVPILGNLFKNVTKTNSKKELVIFIRATIVGSSGSADPYDKAVYEKFIEDPRPLKF